MARILDRLPIPEVEAMTFVGQEMVPIYALEIVVWVSLTSRDVFDPSRLPRFPALLDTAHTHNFSIQEEHLTRWAGLSPDGLSLGVGEVRHRGSHLPLRAAKLWLHSNVPGHWDRIANRPPFRVLAPEGVLVYPAGSDFPRLPLVGLRAVRRNKWRLGVDGKTGFVSLKTGPWWRPFG
jgi:hypothetical protein